MPSGAEAKRDDQILLWQEYQLGAGENAYGYSQFCYLYGEWLKQQKRSIRQYHVAGETLFLDFFGPTIPVTPHK